MKDQVSGSSVPIKSIRNLVPSGECLAEVLEGHGTGM